MSQTLMILGASVLQVPAIEAAKRLGLNVVVVDMNPKAVGFQIPGITTEIISTIDTPRILEAAKRHCIDGIMTLATDMPIRTVATVAKELNLIGVSQETAMNATNKCNMRNILKKNGIPIPVFYKASNKDEYLEAVKYLSDSFIIKPADSSGSRGIFKLSANMDVKQLIEAYEYSKSFSHSGDVIVEEFMQGPEVSVETLAINGKCKVIQITDKITTGAPHFVELGHSQPSCLNPEVLKEIEKITISANKALGIFSGPSHTEIIVTSEGPKVVEIGARLGGDNITTHLVPLSTGINMVEACIRIALAEKPDICPKYHYGSAIRYFKQHEGIMKSISGIDEAYKVAGIKQVTCTREIGEHISNIVDSSSRIGFVIAQDDNVKKAINDCKIALNKIKIDIR